LKRIGATSLLKVGAGASAAKAIPKEPIANTLTAQAIEINLLLCADIVKTTIQPANCDAEKRNFSFLIKPYYQGTHGRDGAEGAAVP
jgi:hypothetical protein